MEALTAEPACPGSAHDRPRVATPATPFRRSGPVGLVDTASTSTHATRTSAGPADHDLDR